VSPAWNASMMHVPGIPPLIVTVGPEMLQVSGVLDGSMLKVTGLPDPPPVAVTGYVRPNEHGQLGAVDVKLIDCAACATSN
jgi:hypothetical protein